ncbi:MAG: hypothetical protein N2A97_00550 [Thermodesulfobacteriales bacterium]
MTEVLIAGVGVLSFFRLHHLSGKGAKTKKVYDLIHIMDSLFHYK